MTTPPAPGDPAQSVVTVFLFTDLVDSTAWKRTLGDAAYTADLRRPHDALFRDLLARFPAAVERDNAGDGFLATFASPGDAVTVALRFHHALATYPWADAVARSGRLPATRIGIHLGEVVEFEDRAGRKVAGQAVDLAARVMGLGVGGQTLLTRHAFDSARQFVRGNPIDADRPLAWPYLGQYRFKGNEDDPLELFAVGVDGASPLAAPPDGDKARRVRVDAADDTGAWRPAVGLAVPRRDGWVLERSVGAGGFGEVWLARHRRTKEARVFKFCFDADRLRSFKRELTFFRLIQAELGDRPDVVRVYEVQVEQPPYLLESEYVPAGNLTDWVAARGGLATWPLADRLRFAAAVARAVAAAHSLGIIHKDLKPSNILVRVDPDGAARPLLADFGIGVLTDRGRLQQGNITETGFTESVLAGNDSSRTGTRLYAPPEAQVGKAATTGTDVYALGVLVYQLAAGDLYRPLGIGWEEAVDGGDPARTALLRDDIRAATFSDPARRLPTAAALAERLDTLDARAAARRRADRAKRARTRAKVAGLVAAFLGLLGVGTTVTALWRAAERARETATVAQGEAETAQGNEKQAREAAEGAFRAEAGARKELEAAQQKLAAVEYGRTMQVAYQMWRENNVAASLVLLAGTRRDRRGWEFDYVNRLCHSDILTIRGHTASVYSAAYSPNGRRVLTAGVDKTARVWDAVAGNERLVLTGHTGFVWSAAFSPDGRRVVTASHDKTARVWDADTGRELAVLKGHAGPVWSAAFSPDGRRVVTAGDDNTARVCDTETWRETLVLKCQSTRVRSAAFSPDSRRVLAAASWDRTVRVWDADTGRELAVLKGHVKDVYSAAFSPDGQRVVTASHDETARVWDADTGRELAILKGHAGHINSAAFSPDGRRVVTAGTDSTARLWDAGTGQEQTVLKGHAGDVESAAFSPDGRRVVTAGDDNTARVWDAGTGRELAVLRGHTDYVYTSAFSPDGKRVVTASRDDTARVWDVETGAELHILKGHADTVYSAAFSPDGRRVVTASDDDTARLWNADIGKELLILKGHTGSVMSAAFSPDGQRVVTGGADHSARIWDADSGTETLALIGHTNAVHSVAFSPNGRRVATGGFDWTARVWDATPINNEVHPRE